MYKMLICGRVVLKIKEEHNCSWDEAVEIYKKKCYLVINANGV